MPIEIKVNASARIQQLAPVQGLSVEEIHELTDDSAWQGRTSGQALFASELMGRVLSASPPPERAGVAEAVNGGGGAHSTAPSALGAAPIGWQRS